MIAYKCDRCGNLFTDADMRNLFKGECPLWHPAYNHERGYFGLTLDSAGFKSDKVDLCPLCLKTLNNWLNDGGASTEKKEHSISHKIIYGEGE